MKNQKFYWVTTKENGEIRICANYRTLVRAINSCIKWGDVTEKLPKKGIIMAARNRGEIYETKKIKVEVKATNGL